MENVPEQVKNLYEALSCIPPEFDRARELLAAYQPTEEELMRVAIELAGDTFCEYSDAMSEERPGKKPEHLHRDYLYDEMAFLLEHGLNPNTLLEPDTDAQNVMINLAFTDGPDVAARVMRLLLEHGGDPNLYVQGETPTTWVDDEMCIDPAYTREYFDNRVQVAMVLQAYGGGWMGKDKKFYTPFTMREGYSSEIFKAFEKFDYRFGEKEGWPGDIHVFEKATGKTVADYV